jgi:serine/threonine protein kinase/tetratricopeptide (TPR) repeat protein
VTGDPFVPLRTALAGRYDLQEPIGQGGMATVFRAHDVRHDRPVAIKVIRPGVLSAGESAERFLREIRYAAQLIHPHILPVYDSGEVADTNPPLLYYVMPYLSGETLRARLTRERRLPVDQALRFARAIAAAMDSAHRRQIVHRDLKPENILLQDGEPMVADFGVARGLFEACDREIVTAPGMAVGTPAYMSPEQASADPTVDPRSDQYSLACVLYEMLVGHPPFTGTSSRATMARHAIEPVPSLRGVRSEVPVAVEHAILRALAKEPADRFASMAEFADALATPLSGLPPAPPPSSTGRAIAVLPFVNASHDPDIEYIADGMTDEAINALANVPGLRVASRTSVFALKGRREDIRTIGALLGVSVVLEGTVRKAGERIRITVQLTDVQEGRLLFSERFDRDDCDLFAIQDEIARAIVVRLRSDLLTDPGEALPRRTTANLAAYNLYLRGRYAWNKRTSEGLNEAVSLFQRAIAEDPGYALAYTGLADTYALRVDYRTAAVTEGMQQARTLAEQAITLDETLAEAHTSLAWVTFIHDWDWSRAEREFRRAIELNPRYATARQWHAWYLAAMGRLAEAIAEGHRGMEIDPASISIRRTLGWLYGVARQPDQAVAVLERALVMNPEAQETHLILGIVQDQAGRYAEADAALREALALWPDDTHALVTKARVAVHAGRPQEALAIAERVRGMGGQRYVSPSDLAKLAIALGEFDPAFAALERAREERRGWLVYIRVDPLFDPLRGDRRFRELQRLMHLE